MQKGRPAPGAIRLAPPPPARWTFGIGARANVDQAHRALSPYTGADGRPRCPVCRGPVRVLDLGPTVSIVGCHGTNLTRLLDEAHAAGYLEHGSEE